MSVAQDWKSRNSHQLNTLNGYAFKPEDWNKLWVTIIRIEQLKESRL